MVTYQEVHNAMRKLERLQEQFLRENGWQEAEDYTWCKDEHELFLDDAVFTEKTVYMR